MYTGTKDFPRLKSTRSDRTIGKLVWSQGGKLPGPGTEEKKEERCRTTTSGQQQTYNAD